MMSSELQSTARLDQREVALQFEKMLGVAMNMAHLLEAAAERDATKAYATQCRTLLGSAREAAEKMAWEFVGDRVAREAVQS